LQSMFLRDENTIAEFAWDKRAIHYKDVIDECIGAHENAGRIERSMKNKEKGRY